jgi:hypothetical protein
MFDIGTAGTRITFDLPTEFFGAKFTGLGNLSGDLMLSFNNGTPQLLTVRGDEADGVTFFGFTSLGAPVTQLSILHNVTGVTRDIYGIDDIITAPIPEPATCVLMAGGLVAIALRRRSA